MRSVSEERSLGRDADPAGVSIRAGPLLDQDLVGGSAGQPLVEAQAQDRPSLPAPSARAFLPAAQPRSRRPPGQRNGAPHSAVTAGAAKLLATTSRISASRSPCPAVSARSATTSPGRSGPGGRPPPAGSQPASCWRRGAIHVVSGQARASGNPGSPAPLPRSRAGPRARPMAPARSSARSIWGSIGPGPMKPRAAGPRPA